MQSVFLGGNTNQGFTSFYGGFCADADDFLYVIKGGPGCGKSSFMKGVASAWERRGLPVLRVFCSGDPDSLDGVYCKSLHLGFVDGTAPHVQEVRYMGVSGAYLDFSPFFDLEAVRAQKDLIRVLSDACSTEYRKAYDLLRAFAAPQRAAIKKPDCFLRAITCKGAVSFYPSDVQTVSPKELRLLLHTPCTVIAHPLFPALIEGVYLPNTAQLAFCPDGQAEQALLRAVSEVAPVLAAAKALHDELETVYRPFVDFAAVDKLLEKYTETEN